MGLLKSKYYSKNEKRVLRAVAKEKEQDTLLKIAAESIVPVSNTVRMAAIQRITIQDYLKHIALTTHRAFELRKAAIERMDDQKILAETVVSLGETHYSGDDKLAAIARGKVQNKQDIDEVWAARKAKEDAWLGPMRKAEEQKKALREERIRAGLCPQCGSNKTPVYGLIKSLDMYGDYCPDCGETIRLS